MKDNPLLALAALGQSIWLDLLRRGIIVSGELRQMIEEDGLRGVTSNPSIFEKAIAGSHDYDEAIHALALEGKSVQEMYQALTVEDVQRAADLFRPLYDRVDGRDGLVSLEVSPHLAYDTEATIAEARTLWKSVNRPNLMIKVPATRQGIPAIRQLISEGITVNVTLLFGLPRYREVAEAYIAGLETLVARGQPLERVASVASFFLSRIDVLIDPQLRKKIQAGGRESGAAEAPRGQVAIASARVAYQMYKEIFGGDRFRRLAGQGARPQRLLWASTSTKDPADSDVKYVEALIGPETVNTMPVETLNAYRDHGHPAPRLEEKVKESYDLLRRLPDAGIDLGAITQQLEDEGVQKFMKSFDTLADALEKKRIAALSEPVDLLSFSLGSHASAIQEGVAGLERTHFTARFWQKDPSLWEADPAGQEGVRNALGWLHVAEKMEESLSDLSGFAAEAKAAGFRHVVHMGMGGSSLAPLVLERAFQPGENGLPLTVLDTTDPATILRVKRAIPLANTLFIVASKSGTTAEPLAFGEYFYSLVGALKGDRAGENFIAITDPGTPLVRLARERGFRRIFLNFSDIGGRYSALSYFGLVPAALMGLDVPELLARALRMVYASASGVPVRENPGLTLGAVMGEMARRGRDKLTFLVAKPVETLGMWLEQLLAESTGKEGTGILPVAGEPVGSPSAYGEDRVFVHVRLKGETEDALARGVAALRDAGQPVVTLQMEDRLDLGQEFFRWEVATAVAGAVLGIDPFDQPNVQESKDNTDRLLAVVRERGQLPEAKPSLVEGPLSLQLQGAAPTVAETLSLFLAQAHAGNYVALLAYLSEEPATDRRLQALRLRLGDGLHRATTLGYGPRYLHSTGQFHKGGSNTGLFLLLTADDAEDAPVPNAPYSFGVFKRAQALGDLEALRRHGRRVVRIHLGADVGEGLAALEKAVELALAGGK
ncbi:MAG: bifunctional transaldolase/phosoglucose isomerase [Dehalococcoidales bacterium]|nr:bifunctional transaldolase/phosoglucose isomerase [Dehalococcoidales bacterium]